MKKKIMTMLMLLVLSLSACGGDTEADEKDRYYEILDANGETLYTIADDGSVAEIDNLINGVTSGEGTLADGEAPEALYTYVCWQETTLLAGEGPEQERDMIEILRLEVPESGNQVLLRVLKEGTDVLAEAVPQLDLGDLLMFSYDVDADTLAALRDPAQIAE